MLRALLLQLIFSIPTTSRLIVFLKYSQELRDFCGFDSVQNNPKYANRFIKQLKTFKKINQLDDSYDPYKVAYGSMPSHAAANPNIQQMYINGHFCYTFKFGIITNGLGIIRDITFYNKDFLKSHPDIIVEKKSGSPDEDKSLANSKALIPVLKDFFKKHPLINPKTFLGDAAFDSIEIYKYLLQETPFEKAYIPLKTRLKLEGLDDTVNKDGIPCCPHDPSLLMKRETDKSTHKSKRVCHCENPCTSSSCGRMIYIYPEKNLRAYLGTARGTGDWDSTYKIRGNVEKSINYLKDSFCVAGRKTQNEKTLHADLLLAGITQLVTVMVADKIHQHQYIQSLIANLFRNYLWVIK